MERSWAPFTSPSYRSPDPSPGKGGTHSKWLFPTKLTQSRQSHRRVQRPSCQVTAELVKQIIDTEHDTKQQTLLQTGSPGDLVRVQCGFGTQAVAFSSPLAVLSALHYSDMREQSSFKTLTQEGHENREQICFIWCCAPHCLAQHLESSILTHKYPMDKSGLVLRKNTEQVQLNKHTVL